MYKNRLFIIFFLILIIVVPTTVYSQIVGTEAFLQGYFLEVGVSACGSYGTAGNAPCGYHPRNNFNSGIGFVSEPARDGWTVGAPAFCGDYFLPGSPVEGWGVQVGNQNYINSNLGTICTTNQITGNIASYNYTNGQTDVVWNGSITSGTGNGLTFSQQTTMYDNNLFFVTTVRICNTTGANIDSIFYTRNVDPDNDIMITGSYNTRDTIISQPTPTNCQALVTSRGSGGNCFMGIGTLSANARVSMGGFNLTTPIRNYYNGVGFQTAVGSTQSADQAIQINYFWQRLTPGQCVEISYAHVLSPADMSIAFTKLGNPTFLSGVRDITTTLKDTVCRNEPTTFTVVDDPTLTWTWAPAGVLSTTTGTTTVLTTANPVTITATASRGSCQAFSRQINVFIDTSIKMSVESRDTFLCLPNQPVQLNFAVTYDTIRANVALCDSYAVNAITHAPLTLTSPTNVSLSNDQLSNCLPIGFPFKFFCVDYKNFYISSNGFISFTAGTGHGCCAGQVLPAAAAPNNLIALAWEDLDPNAGGTISYQTIGTTPNRILIVNFANVRHRGGAPTHPVTGQILLYETTNVIEVHLTSMPGPGSGNNAHTVGIENVNGTRGFAPAGFNGVVGWTATNLAWRFSPAIRRGPPLPLTYAWSPTTGLSSTTILNPIATTPVTRTYRLCASNGYCVNVCDTVRIEVSPAITRTINATICSNQTYLFNGVNRNTTGAYKDTFVNYRGCDSVVTLNLTVNPVRTRTINATICSNQTYLFNGVNRNTTGSYLDTFTAVNGCDSVVTLNLTVNPTRTGTINATICSNQTYLFNGVNRNTTGSYIDTFTAINGCDSVVTLNLTVNPTRTGTINATICSNQTYLFNGVNRNTTGSYIDTFIAVNGCDSVVTLNLTVNPTRTGTINATICSNQTYSFNNVNRNTTGSYLDTFTAVNGCDSVVTLNLTVNPTRTGTINATICSNQTYNYNGVNLNTTGSYLDTFTAINGCDSVVTLNLTVNPTRTGTINATICSNQTYLFNGVNRNTTGSYIDTFTAINGCDSVVTLNLTVNPTRTGTINATICSNQTYLFNGVNRNTTGSYIDTFTAINGCDSVVTLNLTVNPTRTGTINATICSNQTYSFNNVNRNTTGSYLDTFTAVNGCDSVVTLNLTVNPTRTGTINATICSNQTYNFNNVNRNTTGSYLDTFTAVNGCDSVVTLNLTVNPTRTGTINATICSNQTYNYNGVNLNTTGSYLDTFTAINGCDSVVTLNLTVNPTRTGTINATICSNQTYLFNGVNRNTTGSYIDTFTAINGCDSVVTLNLTVNPTRTGTINATICSNQTYNYNGVNLNTTGSYLDTFTAVNGCDSVVTLNLTVNPTRTGTINATICSNQTYNYNGVNLNTTGSYLDTFTAVNGCDSVVTLNLTVNPTRTGTINATICSNQTYSFNNVNRNTTGSYLDTFTAVNGCDSVVTLNLTVNPTRTGTINATICSNQTYSFNNVNRNTTGSYIDTFTAINGCDSVVTLNLTVNPTRTGTINATICSNQTYNYNGVNLNTTGSYLDTFTAVNGCDSVVTLNLTVNPTRTGTINATICSNQTYNYNGVNLNTTGSYLDTFTAVNGCDSVVTLNLTVNPTRTGTINATICSNQTYNYNGVNLNTTGSYLDTFTAVNGCDSVVTLNLTVNPTRTGTINATICSNQTYNFNNVNRNTTGSYLDTFTAVNGCDSVVTLNLTVNPTRTGTISATICSNQTYSFNNVNRNTTGSYLDTFTAVNGCDSVVTLNLTVNPTRTGTINATICSNQTYSFNNVNRNTTGSYLDTFTAINGCDSVVTLNLTVNPTRTGTINATICSNQTYNYNGVNLNTTGSYLDTFTAVNGCDSVVTLNLTVNPTRTGTINATICSNQTYNYNGVNLNTTGSYLDTFTAVNGCDSVVTLNLTVNPTRTGTINATICSNQTYNYNGVNLNTTGSYLDTFTAVNGCDSVVTLNLTVNPTRTGTINATICSNQTYNFNNVNRNTTGSYLDTFTAVNGCDSVVTLNLTVNPTRTGTISATICSNQTYNYNGVNLNTTGSYLDTFTAVNGCDSVVTLNLTVNPTRTGTINATICSNQTYNYNGVNLNTTGSYLDTFTAVNGCDSVVTLNLTVNPTRTGTINATICSNQTYLFNGVNRNTTGSYIDTFTAINGCDSVVTLNLTVNPTRTGTINATICSNQTYNYNGVNLNTTGSYLDTFTAVNGCDSVVTLNLTVNPTRTGTINATICSNQTYSFNNVNRNTTGSYLDTFTAVNGCDSVVTLNLTVNPTRTGTINATICSNQTYSFNNVNRNTTGSYIDTFTAINGCDSVVTLNLTVNPTRTGTINATICSNQTYNYNGVNLNTTGSYLDTFTAVNGCDSVVTLNLTVNPTRTGTINATICSNQTYNYNGVNLNTTGSYLDTFTAVNGCDSVVTLNLTVNPTRTGTINATICSNQTYLFNGVNRNTTGSYIDTFTAINGCDSVVTLNLTVNPTRTGTINATICSNQTYNYNGVNLNTTGSYLDTFTAVNGCDSVVTLNLTVNPTRTGTINATICSNQTYSFNNVNRNTTGSYLDTFTAVNGCDSVVTLNLTVNPTRTGTINATICSNQTYSFNNVNRNTTGSYLDTFTAVNGCDSVVTLNLTVNPTRTGTINATICSNQTYLFNGVNRNTTGSYIDTFTAINGCDSVVTLNLTVNPTRTGTINATICSNQTYNYNGVNLNTTGSYLDTFTAVNGCDSVVTLNLTVNPTRTGTINATICSNQTYNYNGVNLNTTGSYLDTFTAVNGCDSVVTLNLTVNPTRTGTINATICSNQTYSFNNVNRNTTGSYLDTFTAVNGCDSVVTLNLTVNPTRTGTINATICSNQTYSFNNVNRNTTGSYIDTFTAINGCDSVVTLNLTVNPTRTGTINATICSNQTYNYNGVNLNTTGSYLDTFTAVNGCDSVVTLNLTVNPTRTGTINATICSNQTYNYNGVNLNTTGSYLDTFTAVNGCDSVVTLNLTVNPTRTGTINATICSNQTYNYNGVNLNTTGSYLDTFTAVNGCDSVVTLNLTVNPTRTGTINATICSNQTYLFNGVNRNTTGSYIDTFTAINGCDSVVTLNLTVNPTRTGTINATICSNQTYNYNGVNLNTTGSYLDTFTAVNGCDSVVTLNLTVNPTRTGTINATICSNQTYNYNGVNLNTTGSYLDTFTAVNGCDSVVTLNLTVNPTRTGTINATICSNQTYNYNGVNLNTTGSYLDTFTAVNGCDSVVTLNLTVNPTRTGTINATICSNQTYNYNGVNLNTTGSYLDTFTAVNGCDSVVTLNLTVNPTRTGTINATICSNQTYSFNNVNRNTTGSYLDTFTAVNGCDSVVTLNLTVNPTRTGTINATICSNQTYNYNGVNLNTTGSYLDTFTAVNGCDSVVTLNLTVNPTRTGTINATICSNQTYNYNGVNLNTTGSYLDTFTAVNGCDSVVTLNLTVNPTRTGTINATICSNQTYSFNNVNRNTTGSYLDTFTAVNGCDSVVTLNLTVNPTRTGTINATICSNQTYNYNGVNLNTTGSYLDTFTAVNGCDSVVTLNLTVNPTRTGTINATICSNQTYNYNGVNLNTTGSYLDTFTAVNGCDSVVTLNLTVNPTRTGTINATICSNQTYNYNGVDLNTTGSYLDTFTAVNGCDSVVTLNLIVLPTTVGTIDITICSNQTYNYNGVDLNTTGSYLDTFTAVNGCDSVVTLNLIVLPTTVGTIDITICSNQTYNYNGVDLNTTGSYLDTFTAVNGCDSVVTLNLIVLPTTVGTIDITICSNQTYNYNGVDLNTTGSYLDTFTAVNGCDSVVTLNLIVLPTTVGTIDITICSNQTYNYNGVDLNTTGSYLDTFTAVNGCDSVVTLNLIVLPTTVGTIDITICSNQTYNYNGVDLNTTGSYLDTFTAVNGCDSVVTLNLIVLPTTVGTIDITICSNQTYNYNGVDLNTTGSYLDTFTAVNGCDSVVTLNLIVLPTTVGTIDITICSNQTYNYNGVDLNTTGSYLDTFTAVNGCDSVVTLNLIVLPTTVGTIDITICSNQTYNYNGVDLNTTGSYLDTFTAVNGCDSVVTLNLIVLPTTVGTIDITICSNQTYNYNGVDLNTTGSYLDTFTAVNGCDSVVTLNLIVLPTTVGTIDITICSNQTYNYNGVDLNTTGSYLDTFTAVNGCDSVVTLNLIVLPTTVGTIDITICSNQTYNYNGVDLNTTGSYLDTFTAVNGCDSVVTLNLIVLPTTVGTIDITICSNQTYNYNGVDLNTTGSYLDTFTAVNGCDSVVTLNLIVLPTTVGTIDITICSNQTYNYNGVDLNTTGSYLDTFTAVNGCDSVVTLNLIVLPTTVGTIDITICSNQTYTYNGVDLNTTGSYLDTFTAVNGCDSVVTLNLIVLPTTVGTIDITICSNQTYNYNGVDLNTTGSYLDTFTAVNGCDSVVTLNLIVLPTTVGTIDITICSNQTYNYNGVDLNITGSYLDTFTAVNGCDSVVTLNLIVLPTTVGTIDITICSNQTYNYNGVNLNITGSYLDTFTAVNGCDSVVTLNLIVLPTTVGTIDITICSNQTYNYNGVDLNTTGSYLDTFTAVNGCDSVVTLNLIVLPTTVGTIDITICSNQTYNYNGVDLNITGSYLDTFTAVNGCDSVVTLNLIVLPTTVGTIDITICSNQTYNYNGVDLNTTGSYLDTFTAVNGCDSVVTLNLIVLPTTVGTIDITICSNQTYNYNGVDLNTTGSYLDTFTAVNGCDSVVTLNLIVLPTTVGTIDITICSNQTYNYNGVDLNTTGSYLDTFTAVNGCDSVVTLNLIVLPTTVGTIDITICSNQTYTYNGVDLNTTGSYLDTFTAVNGCDSVVTLNLIVLPTTVGTIDITICSNQTYNYNGVDLNTTGSYLDTFTAVNGCDSVVTLNLIVLPTTVGTIDITICSNQTYNYNGVDLNTTGSYLDTFTAVNGCDSVVTLNLIVLPTTVGTIDITICSNQTYNYNGVDLNTTGSYLDTFTAVNGCDSVVTLNLIVLPTTVGTIDITICSNQTYNYNGVDLNTTGSYLDTFTAVNGCDSVVTLNLIVLPTTVGTIDITICSNQTYNYNGVDLNTTGSYLDTFTAVNGCDSVVTLNLIVLPTTVGTIDITICSNQTYNYNGVDLNTTGSYLDTFTAVNGCDSVVTLNLIVLPTTVGTIDITICSNQTYNYNGVDLNTTGSYLDTFTAVNGCDSVVTLNLIVLPTTVGTIDITICSNQTYNYNGVDLNTTGSYLDTFTAVNGCDSVVTLNLIVLPTTVGTIDITICSNQTYNYNGVDLNTTGSYLDTFTAVNGCDSVVTLNLIVLPTTVGTIDITICSNQTYTYNGVDLNTTGSYLDTFTAVNGCDSVVTLNLIVLPTTVGTIDITICSNQTYNYNGVDLNTTGSYLDTFTAVNGCDSVVTLNLIVLPTTVGTIDITICSNQTYNYNGVDLNITGSYLDTFTAVNGCDSVVTLNLIVLPTTVGTIDITICSNQTYNYNGVDLNITGSYLDTFTAVNGCDSVVTLNLIVLPTTVGTIDITICSNQTYNYNGVNLNITGSYLDTFTAVNGCDSVVTLNLIVLPTTVGTIDITICSNQTYNYNGVDLNTTGSYLDTFTAVNGCDSVVTLNLIVLPTTVGTIDITICSNQTYNYNGVDLNITGSYLDTFTAVNGCDSVVTLNLIVLPTTVGTIDITICSNQTYNYNGVDLNTTGSYLDTFTAVNGCDSVVTLNLIVLPTTVGTIDITICSNQTYNYNGVDLNTTGSYLDTFTAVNGCDSVVTLNLIVLPTTVGTIDITICSNQTYTYNGVDLNTTGSYLDTFTAVNGCDSVVTLNLIVLPTTVGTIDITICSNQTYNYNGVDLNTTGSYLDTFTAVNGCDSVVTLNLIVLPTTVGTIDITICSNQTYNYNGVDLNTTGSYLDTFTAVNGCDSVVTLNLIVLPTTVGTIDITICSNQTYNYNGVDLNTTGSYLDTFTAVNGCDSVVTLNLIVLPTTVGTIDITICSNQTYNYNGVDLNTTGSYLDTFTAVNGCDSVVTLNLIVLPTTVGTIDITICSNQTYTYNGVDLNTTGSYLDTFTAVNGCDSVVTLNLVVNSISSGSVTANICTGQHYIFNGLDLTTTGIYEDTITNSIGCDSFLTLNLNVSPIILVNQSFTICSPGTIVVGTNTYNTSGVYNDTTSTSTGCDSVTITTLVVLPTSIGSINALICSNQTYNYNGVDLNTTGSYLDTFTAVNGCDSVVTLNLIVLPTTVGTIDITICSNQTYNYNGVDLNTTGSYLDTFTAVNGCDSVVTLNLIVLPTTVGTIDITICSNQTYNYNGVDLNTTGSYLDTFTAVNGCDSVVTLNLIVLPTTVGTIDITICSNQTYNYNGVDLNTTGSYLDTFTAVNGCDSVVTLNLIVLPTTVGTIDITICSNQTYNYNGVDLNTTGSYLDTFTAVNGCDSVVTLNLIVLPTTVGTIDITICSNQTYNYNGVDLNTTGSYLDTFTAVNGCDSVVTLNLIVLPTTVGTIDITICSNQTYNYNGVDLNTTGSYLDTFTAVNGCDSVVTLNLIVLPTTVGTIDITICSNQTYNYNGVDLNTTGSYLDTFTAVNGCDSVVTLDLLVNLTQSDTINAIIYSNQVYTFNGVNLNISGQYLDTLSSIVACDSLLVLNLTILPTDTVLYSTICANQTYPFNGVNLNTTGIYRDTFVNIAGFDSIVILNLQVLPISNNLINAVICTNQYYLFNGTNINSSGIYYDTLINTNGCDSFITLNLVVNHTDTFDIYATICSSDIVYFNGAYRNLVGVYLDTFINYLGCDSILRLNLDHYSGGSGVINATICSNQSYYFNGINNNISGTYTEIYSNMFGCDSVVTLNLVVLPISTRNINATICSNQSYLFNGQNLTTAGVFRDTFVNYQGCDSFLILNLNILPTVTSTLNVSICSGSSYLFNSVSISASGLYLDTFTNYRGCDSVLVLNLTVNPILSGIVNAIICSNQYYNFYGNNLSLTGTYFDTTISSLGCDSIVMLNLSILTISYDTISQSICLGQSYYFNGINLNVAGTYDDTLINYLGCDSVLYLNLTIYPTSTDTAFVGICNGNSYLFNGVTLTTSGLYLDTFTNIYGCDSVFVIRLRVYNVTTTIIETSICYNQVYLFDGVNINVSGIYYDTMSNFIGCDSIIMLKLTVIPLIVTNINATICTNDVYAFNGVNLNTPGTYRDTLTSYNSCDSFIILNLTINSISVIVLNPVICSGDVYVFSGIPRTTSGTYIDTLTNIRGCDSVVIVNLIVNPINNIVVTTSICENQIYSFNGMDLNRAGTYFDTLRNNNGCDSFVTLNLSIIPISTYYLNVSICNNSSYNFNGQLINTSGIYLDTLVNFRGCDSVVVLNLTVIPTQTSTLNITICNNEVYYFNGLNISSAGIYLDTLLSYLGCDSIISLNLTMNPVSRVSIFETICSNETYLFNGIYRNATGIYLDTFTNRRGCDSVLELNLTVVPIVYNTISRTICENQYYLFNGVFLTDAGTYVDTLVNYRGCDSVLTLNLSVNPTSFSTINNVVICANDRYIFNGVQVLQSGTYFDTLINYLGCDSVIRLVITVLPISTDTIQVTVCANQTYVFNGLILDSSGVYSDTFMNDYGCDSILTLLLTVRTEKIDTISAIICIGDSINFAGNYVSNAGTYSDTILSSLGCDSMIVLNLLLNSNNTDTIYASIYSNQTYNFNNLILDSTGYYYDTLQTYIGCDSLVVLNLIVNRIVIAVDDYSNTGIDQSVVVDILINDTFTSGALDTNFSILIDPTFGTTIVNPDGTVTYIPNSGYVGFDSFQYVLCLTYNDTVLCDTAWAHVLIDNEDLSIPNGFSPNGDGTNDIFDIPGIYKYPSATLKVYNRWGDEVWDSGMPYISKKWQGTNDFDENLPDGTYFFVLDLKNNSKPIARFVVIHRGN